MPRYTERVSSDHFVCGPLNRDGTEPAINDPYDVRFYQNLYMESNYTAATQLRQAARDAAWL